MISLFGSNVGAEELAAVKECMDQQWLGIGAKSEEFEKQIAQMCAAPGFVFLNSGSNSLHLAIRLLDLPEGSEVILPSFTWIACANAVQLNRLKPVFCDVDTRTCNLRPEDVEPRITPRTAAIMAVHYSGKPVDMDGLREFGLPIIEDAAHAIDSYYKGKHCGTLGDVGIFSFDAVKNLTTCEGGGVLAHDPKQLERARKLRYCGIAKSGFQASATKARWWEYDISEFFPKMLNTDVNAAIGLVQLQKLPRFQARRKELWELYNSILREEEWAASWLRTLADAGPGEQHSYFCYQIQLEHGSRDHLAKFLYDNGIYTSLRFHPLHLNAIYECKHALPNCEHLNRVALNLPLHHRMELTDVEQICDALRAFRAQHI